MPAYFSDDHVRGLVRKLDEEGYGGAAMAAFGAYAEEVRKDAPTASFSPTDVAMFLLGFVGGRRYGRAERN